MYMKKFTDRTIEISELLKNFSNKDKLAILCYLWNEEKTVSDILNCSNISQSQTSQFLWRMKLEAILESRKEWKEVFYKISDPKILEIISSLKKIFSK